ncbi:Innexin [Caenorhabditis elegans]|uniref:Innexin n=1 Tax=Caenorhabditis elegans TaxID=6239 RepID=Q9N3R4_CAEEL|nr:Innexin [Caenorhabditis elegans]CCD72546.1 Innexin [Caenorhabditis elegans]|eukprot:NP_491187.2 Innexin [Caenorhabditis elegans]
MTKAAVTSFTDPLKRIRGLESGTEKLLHNTTIAILVFLFILLASKPMFGSPIVCQVPKDWPSSSVDYFTDICYYGQREKVDIQHRISRAGGRGTVTVNLTTGTSEFYMWVPLVPILLVALCLLPAFFWKFVGLDCFNGMDIVSFLEFYEQTDDPGERLVEMEGWRRRKLAAQLNKWIMAKRNFFCGLSQTMIIYVLMKWFRTILFIAQFWIIADVFGDGNFFWGYADLARIANGDSINPLKGSFTLISGCRVQRLAMSIGFYRSYTNAHSAVARCMLSANFLNAKAFLVLYWWFLLVSFISLCSAIHYTIILLVPQYRRHEFKSMIRTEDHFIERYGEPHPNLHLGKEAPLEYLVEHLGNDGFLVVEMVYDMLHHYECDRFTEHIWMHIIVHNGEEDFEDDEIENKKIKIVDEMEMDGAGDRNSGGIDKKETNDWSSSAGTSKNKDSTSKVSLSASQPSMMMSESDEEPMISPAVFTSLSS